MNPIVDKIVREVEFRLASVPDDVDAANILDRVIEQLEDLAHEWRYGR